jgi:hypothetical protein
LYRDRVFIKEKEREGKEEVGERECNQKESGK